MWKSPIQDEQLRQQISAKLDEISTVLKNKPVQLHNGLLNGESGILLFDCYRSLQLDSADDTERIHGKIIDIFSNLHGVHSGIFSMGVAGILWTLDHLDKSGFIEMEPENFSDISQSLSNSMIKNSQSANFDYLHGANGIALYLNGRAEETAHVYVDHWLQLLEESGIQANDTITWKSLINAKKQSYGNNLGLAHGISSTIIILTKQLKRAPNKRAEALLDKCINFLLENKNEDGSPYFPNYIIEGEKHNVVRPAWCYGDMGSAMALYFAGDFLKRAELKTLALEILEKYALNAGPEQDKYLHDADFCHGSVGVAHIFSRFYNYTGNEKFRAAAEYYYRKTIDMAMHPDGLAGYKHLTDDGLVTDYSLLEGISGIGLSMISAVSDIEPQWDQCFLLSN